MKIDCGFWDKNGNYKKDVQEVEMLSVKELNEIEFIKAQNVRLIEQNRELQKELQPFKDDYFKGLDNKTIAELAKKSIRITSENRRLENCLQEIKAIAETASPYIDNFEIKTATEIGYDYATICNELELRLHKVLELITKAEEE